MSKILQELELEIRILTANEIAVMKGIPINSLNNINIQYNEKLKIVDEASDVNVYTHTFKKLLQEND